MLWGPLVRRVNRGRAVVTGEADRRSVDVEAVVVLHGRHPLPDAAREGGLLGVVAERIGVPDTFAAGVVDVVVIHIDEAAHPVEVGPGIIVRQAGEGAAAGRLRAEIVVEVTCRIEHVALRDRPTGDQRRRGIIEAARQEDLEVRVEVGHRVTALGPDGVGGLPALVQRPVVVTHGQEPSLKEGSSQLILVDIDVSSGAPKLTNKRVIYESKDRSCVLEAQDFYDNNSKLTFTCYDPERRASTMSIDLKSKQVTNMSNHVGYSEVEGIFPNGQYTLVESDRQCEWLGGQPGSGNIDIWKLKLDGTGKDFERITNFNDYEGAKASNPVISSDGRYMAFQSARTSDPAGVGYGLLLYSFK